MQAHMLEYTQTHEYTCFKRKVEVIGNHSRKPEEAKSLRLIYKKAINQV